MNILPIPGFWNMQLCKKWCYWPRGTRPKQVGRQVKEDRFLSFFGWLWQCANKTLFMDTEIRTSYNCYVKQKSYSFFQTLKDIKTKFGLCAIEKQAERQSWPTLTLEHIFLTSPWGKWLTPPSPLHAVEHENLRVHPDSFPSLPPIHRGGFGAWLQAIQLVSDSVRLELGCLDLSPTYLPPLGSKNQNLRFHPQPQNPSAISHQQFTIFFFTLKEFIPTNILKLRIR